MWVERGSLEVAALATFPSGTYADVVRCRVAAVRPCPVAHRLLDSFGCTDHRVRSLVFSTNLPVLVGPYEFWVWKSWGLNLN